MTTDEPSLQSVAQAIGDTFDRLGENLGEKFSQAVEYVWTMPLTDLVEVILWFMVVILFLGLIWAVFASVALWWRWLWNKLGDNKAKRLGRWVGAKLRSRGKGTKPIGRH